MTQPVTLVLHGGLLAASCLDLETSPVLLAQRTLHRVTRPGYPGSGTSASGFAQQPVGASAMMPALVAHTLAAASALDHETVDVLAYSMGAAVALATALEAPHRVRSLTLLDPPLLTLAASGAALLAQLQTLPQLRASMSPDALAEALIDGSIGEGIVQARPELLGHSGNTAVQEALIQSLDAFLQIDVPALLQWSPSESELTQLTMPVHIVAGGTSDTVYGQSVGILLRAVPHARVSVIEHANHALHLTHSSAVISAIAQTFAGPAALSRTA